uniref:NADH dehydrogenase subunit 2 n=1 Tax=Xylophaga washingtona TaxID=1049057 RepID=UPI002028523F|nr:NADH dehydrogenase subunit 2 [Xylophaga washingtona]UPX88945.1 NADH dehydrogenase subunit 2 [Xylophaga washingtona]UPX88957.1 NADH dehydrogenase subunit 2 [Xylophaga washingtona]
MVLKFTRFSPSLVFFSFFMVFGLAFVFTSSGLLGVWVGLECGFLGVVSLLAGESAEESEGCMKYFVFQSVGSGVLFFSFVLLGVGANSGVCWGFLLLGFCLKLGLFPFHYWVPSVMSTCSWFSCFVISVWQKVAPLWVLGGFGFSGVSLVLVESVVCLTGVIGALGGLGLLHYRCLLGYSSLIHTSWMVLLCLVSAWGCILYLFVYGVVLGFLIKNLFSFGIHSMLDFNGFWAPSSSGFFLVFLDFISLGGVPPFLGSFPKVLTILLCWKVFPFGVAVLILCSMVSLYYYLSVSIAAAVGMGINLSFIKEGGLGILEKRSSLFVSTFTGVSFIVGVSLLVALGFGG